jgi:hypothetical protein
MVAIGAAGFIAAFALPFAGADIATYYAELKLSAHRGMDRWLFESDVVMIALLLTPAAWIYVFHRPRMSWQLRVFFASTAGCMLLVLIPASSLGAGPHHFLPFMPSLSWGFFSLFLAARESAPRSASLPSFGASTSVLLLAVVLGYSPIVAQSWAMTFDTYGQALALRPAISEIYSILDEHQSLTAAIGPGLSPNFDATSLRVIPVFRDNPLPIDPVTLSDYAAENVAIHDEAVRKILRECRVDLWLFPRNAAFISPFGEPMLTDALMRDFHDSYTMVESDKTFEQWQCRHRISEGRPN